LNTTLLPFQRGPSLPFWGFLRSNNWTLERRKKQSEAIHRWKPWEKTKGPRTIQVQAASSMNALKLGMRSAENLEVERLISLKDYSILEAAIWRRGKWQDTAPIFVSMCAGNY
jgi:hypothetical protein